MDVLRQVISETDVQRYCEAAELQLLGGSARFRVKSNRQWSADMPALPGVYAIFEVEELVYVGETGNLAGRMIDLTDTRNHTLRRTMGAVLFAGCTGFETATSSRKFPSEIETQLRAHFESKLSVALLPMSIGRKEVEEYMINKFSPKYNKKSRRE